jgi:phage baseplate assembly protein W
MPVGGGNLILNPGISGSANIALVCPGGGGGSPVGPNPPIILSISQASNMIVCGVIQDPVTGSYPISSLKLYRAPSASGPWTFLVATVPISLISVVNQLIDQNPIFGTQEYYAATAVDTQGFESGISNIVTYTAAHILVGLQIANISSSARGPYPVLGCDVYIDPTSGEGVIGPNGDLLTVNGLECLAQDIRIRFSTDPGELPLHPNFGLGKSHVIGSGQAAPQVQAQILRADFIDMLQQEPRVQRVLDVVITQSNQDSWMIAYDIEAIGVEDAVRLNLVFPYYLTGSATLPGSA